MFLRVLKTVGKGVLILLVTLVLDVAGAQVAKRFFEFWSYSEHNKKYRTYSDIYHHGLAPNITVIGKWGPRLYPITTNSLGFKDGEMRRIPAQAARPRLLFMGDSFTEGVGVAYADTFVGRIGQALAGRGVSVLNAGVNSYAPSIYFARTRHLLDEEGLQVDGVVVFLDVSDIWDEAMEYSLSEKGTVKADYPPGHLEKSSRRNFLKDNSIIANFSYRLRDLFYYYYNYFSLQRAGASKHFPGATIDPNVAKMIMFERGMWTISDEDFARYGRQGLDKAGRVMDRLYRLLGERGIPLTIAVYPWPAQIVARDLDSRQVRFWRQWAGERGVPFIDLFPLFIDSRPAEEVLNELFMPGDIHWNEKGHALVARTVLQHGIAGIIP